MSLRSLGVKCGFFSKHLSSSPNHFALRFSISISTMSYRPNYQGGRRGAGGRGGGGPRGGGHRGGRGAGGGGRGEQRWWDPVWRAERLRQQAAEVLPLSRMSYDRVIPL